MKYRQITSSERYAIAALRRQGLSLSAIARNLGRAPSTIAREVRRSRCNDLGYWPFKADSRTRGRRSRSRRNERFTPDDWMIVERYLRLDWSPEQVSGFLRVEGLLRITYETIYLRVWYDERTGGELWRHLRQAGKKQRKRYISERPPEVESRTEVGHWETDTVMGNDRSRHSVVTIVERATGCLQIGKLERHTAAETTERCVEIERGCICPSCPVCAVDDLKLQFYCTRGSENAQSGA